jgi:hypothetical protein
MCDTFGRLKACVLLEHSLKRGFNAPNVQFETIRKTHLAVSHYDSTTTEDLQLHWLSGYKRGVKQSFAGTTVYREWFNNFIMGCHARMGDDRRHDQAIPVEVMLKVQESLEHDLFEGPAVDQMLQVCVHVVFFIYGFYAGLHWEELPLMSLDATEKY